jgi:hypothetical protein
MKDPERALVAAAVVIVPRADGEISDSVAVEISERGDRASEAIVGAQETAEAALGGADLSVVAHRPVALEKEEPYGSGIGGAVIVLRGSDGGILDSVPVEVPERGHGAPEPIPRVEKAGEPAFARADLLLRFYRAVGVEAEDPDGARVGAQVRVAERADGEIVHTVVIEVADVRH